MKSDMPKIICERPRVGGGLKEPKGYKKEFHDTPWDEQPKSEPIRLKWKKHYSDCKEFSERLGPLWRWLLSKVGQPWHLVHSELCANLKRDSVIQDHVRDHAEEMVVTNVINNNGVICHGIGILHGMPLADYREQLYVHPDTGLLTLIQGHKREYKKPENFIRKDDAHIYKKIKGIWYLVGIVSYTPTYHKVKICERIYEVFDRRFQDMLIGKVEHPSNSVKAYGGYFKAVSKKQLNSREIKAAGLKGL
jgi:hypothetical protein